MLSDGDGPAIDSEGYDLINFGSSNVSGESLFVVGAGFRSALTDELDLGVAYEVGLDHDDGIFDDRLTVDLVWKF